MTLVAPKINEKQSENHPQGWMSLVPTVPQSASCPLQHAHEVLLPVINPLCQGGWGVRPLLLSKKKMSSCEQENEDRKQEHRGLNYHEFPSGSHSHCLIPSDPSSALLPGGLPKTAPTPSFPWLEYSNGSPLPLAWNMASCAWEGGGLSSSVTAS